MELAPVILQDKLHFPLDARIVGAYWNSENRCIVLEVEGPDVPDKGLGELLVPMVTHTPESYLWSWEARV